MSSSREDLNKLETTLNKILLLMLTENLVKNKPVDRLVVSPSKLVIYEEIYDDVKNKFTFLEIMTVLEGGSKMIDMSFVETLINKFLKIRRAPTFDRDEKFDDSYKYIYLFKYNEGDEIQITKKTYYESNCYESNMDRHPIEEKMVDLAVDTKDDLAIATLIKTGKFSGTLNSKTGEIRSLDQEGNSEYLGSYIAKSSSEKPNIMMPLSFLKSGYSYNKYKISEDIYGITVANTLLKIKDSNLRNIYKNNSGIVLLDSFLAQELILLTDTSEITEANKDLFVAVIKEEAKVETDIANSNTKIRINTIYLNSKERKYQIKSLAATPYSMIIDDDNSLNLEEIIMLSERHTLVLGKPIKNIEQFFNNLRTEEERIREGFINRLIMIGSLRKDKSISVSTEIKKRILDSEVDILRKIFDEVDLEKVLLSLFQNKNILSLRYANNLEVNDGKGFKKVDNLYVSNKMIKTMFSSNCGADSEDSDSCMFVKKVTNNVNRMDSRLIKTVIYDVTSNPKIQMFPIPRVQNNLGLEDQLFVEGLNLIYGEVGSGRTSILKKNLSFSNEDTIYIYDRDYEFTELDFDLSSIQTPVFIRTELNIPIIRKIRPTLIIINSEISVENLIQILRLVQKCTKIIMISDTFFLEDLNEYEEFKKMLKRKNINFKPIKSEGRT